MKNCCTQRLQVSTKLVATVKADRAGPHSGKTFLWIFYAQPDTSSGSPNPTTVCLLHISYPLAVSALLDPHFFPVSPPAAAWPSVQPPSDWFSLT